MDDITGHIISLRKKAESNPEKEIKVEDYFIPGEYTNSRGGSTYPCCFMNRDGFVGIKMVESVKLSGLFLTI